MIASFDLSQAFYKVDRSLLEEVLLQRLDSESTFLQAVRRFDKVIYRLHQGTTIVELDAPTGIVVGDVIGPLAFVVFMDGFLRDLKAEREAARWPSPLRAALKESMASRSRSEARGLVTHFTTEQESYDLSDLVYADDHDMFRPVPGWRRAREELELVRMIHKKWSLQVNPAKSSVMVNWMGKGSGKIRSRGGKHVKLTDGELIPLVKEQTHLGSIRHVTGSTALMVDSRIKKYRGVKARFQKKLLGNHKIPLQTRVKFFQSLLTPVLVHGLECGSRKGWLPTTGGSPNESLESGYG